MSDEIQEILKDYKFQQLHEHLFDGSDDIWLSKLDHIFDSSYLDREMFGKEMPSHFVLMSIVGGMFALPLYVIINYVYGDSLTSFMGIMNAARSSSSFNFYAVMFDTQW